MSGVTTQVYTQQSKEDKGSDFSETRTYTLSPPQGHQRGAFQAAKVAEPERRWIVLFTFHTISRPPLLFASIFFARFPPFYLSFLFSSLGSSTCKQSLRAQPGSYSLLTSLVRDAYFYRYQDGSSHVDPVDPDMGSSSL